jgi:hypothetical protein
MLHFYIIIFNLDLDLNKYNFFKVYNIVFVKINKFSYFL